MLSLYMSEAEELHIKQACTAPASDNGHRKASLSHRAVEKTWQRGFYVVIGSCIEGLVAGSKLKQKDACKLLGVVCRQFCSSLEQAVWSVRWIIRRRN